MADAENIFMAEGADLDFYDLSPMEKSDAHGNNTEATHLRGDT